MSAHCFYDLPVPEDIMDGLWDYTERVRRMPRSELAQAVRDYATHQYRRERAARASGREGDSVWLDDNWVDDRQRGGERT